MEQASNEFSDFEDDTFFNSADVQRQIDQAIAKKQRRDSIRENGRFKQSDSYQPPPLLFKYELKSTETDHSRRLRRTEHEFRYQVTHNFQEILDLTLVGNQLDSLFEQMVKPAVEKAKKNDRIAIEVHHQDLNTPLYVSYVRKDRLDYSDFCNKIYQVSQSATTWLMDGEISVIVKVIENTSGGGVQTIDENNTNSRTFVTIHARNNECGHLAIMLGHYALNHDIKGKDKSQWRNLCNTKRRNQLRNLAMEYASINGIDYNEPVDFDVINQYASTLGGVQIVVMRRYKDQPRKEAVKIFATPPSPQKIYLELVEDETNGNHFNCITNITGYLQKKFFCHNCYKSGDPRYHKCEDACACCNMHPPCQDIKQKIQCLDCNRHFNGQKGLENHKKNRTCATQVKCGRCLVDYPKNKKHECLVTHCTRCGEKYQYGSHHCYLKPLNLEKLQESDEKNRIRVYFDVESMMVSRDGRECHEPNLLVSMAICNHCYIPENINKPLPMKEGDCVVCGSFMRVFRGRSCVEEFGSYLYREMQSRATIDKENPLEIKVMAHNLSGYDGRFILRDLFTRDFAKSPQIIMNGSKISMVDIDVIRFQDSFKLMPSALRTFPKAFGFSQRVAKGHFPYLFNTPENQGYIGKMPTLEDFGYKHMKPADQEELQSWHQTVENSTFNLQKEMEMYCINDVEILMIAVEQFRREFKSMTSLDPIARKFTLPSICMEVYQSQMLEKHTIGITPIIPYGIKRRDSRIAKTYLDWIENTRNVSLIREQKIGNVYVDGFDEKTSTIYEFLGCYYHGCPKCQKNRSLKHNGKTMEEKYLQTMEKIGYFEHLRKHLIRNLNWVLEWECEFRREMKINPLLKHFCSERQKYWETIENIGHLDLRDAYFGGRTNNARFHCIITDKENEKIKYQDFTSLYPSVLFRHAYPVGHPTVINSNFDYTLESYFGFVKCKVQAPLHLFFPILPSRINGKPMFVLCEECAKKKETKPCTHSREQRAFVGSFCTVELKEAIKHGYEIEQIYEVLHYENQSSALFNEYISMFMREKFHASGYPEWVHTEEDKDRYIEDLHTRQGIKLEKEKIEKNPIKRMIAKLLLNTLYGKFGQRVNMPKTELVRDYGTLWDIVSSGMYEVTGDTMVAEDRVLITYKMASDANCHENKSNVAIAAFVTSYARLELFSLIHRIESNHPGSVQYFDTDSVIYKYTRGDPIEECGDLLGQLTDELDGGDCFKLVCLGPKNYAYEITNEDGTTKSVIKAKGVKLTAKSLETINLERMTTMAKELCENNRTIEDVVQQQRIGCLNRQQEVVTMDFLKKYRAVSDKRMIVGNDTLPYGWQK